MIIYDGNTREVSFAEDTPLTAEEIVELEALAADQPAPEPTAEERIAVLEEALNMLLSGVTE